MSLLSNFPSYDAVIKGAARTFARYPFALLSAIFATIVTVMLVEQPQPENHQLLERLQLTGALGIAFFVALVHFAEKMRWRKQANLALQFGGLVLLLVYYLTLPEDVFDAYIDVVRFLLLAIGLHFLVAVLPYVADKQVQGFWQYNKSLFLRFLTAALYSGVLYVGLTIALAAADHLFNMDVPSERYFQMWLITVGIFNTWVFLAGVPVDLHRLSDDYAYPKGLKVFTQYILLSLVALYFVILIAYEAKIIIEWNWPKGWVSHLVLWYSVVGILSALLLHPLKEQSGNRWIQAFTTWFYRLLIPLVILLFLAIMRRISDYGITENRYFVLAMAIGLGIAVLYFIISRKKDIRIIPGILCILAFLSALGPWSAFSISLSDQQGRLEGMMIRYNILVDGTIQKTQEKIPLEDRRQLSSIVSYLNDWHGPDSFSGWIEDSILTSLDTMTGLTQDIEITRLMGFEWVGRFRELETGRYFSAKRRSSEAFDITGYQQQVGFYIGDAEEVISVSGVPGAMKFDREQRLLSIRLGVGESRDSLVEISLSKAIDEFVDYDEVTLEAARLTFSGECEIFEARVVCYQISGWHRDGALSSGYIQGDLLLRLK
ncbi:MAG: DUF4153 domain-containing protein [Candidatus Zixiibacteriota bacterium]|nr:MAG: DUF4153 domain-containing protein [candidate division Zixibacteria bacterium]